MPDLPPQPFGDTRDIADIMAAEEPLGFCISCNDFRPMVGIRPGAAAYGMLCFPHWKQATGGRVADAAGNVEQLIAPGNPLNL